MYNMSSNTKIS